MGYGSFDAEKGGAPKRFKGPKGHHDGFRYDGGPRKNRHQRNKVAEEVTGRNFVKAARIIAETFDPSKR